MFEAIKKRFDNLTGILRSRFIIWVALSIILLLLIGLSHMYARVTTLAYVQGYDFMILKRALDKLDLKNPNDKEVMESVINVLSGKDRALFPIAIISTETCFENNNNNGLCRLFPNSDKFRLVKSEGTVQLVKRNDLSLSLSLLKDIRERYFAFETLRNGDLIVAETSPYLVAGDSFMASESLFAKDAYKYISDPASLILMYRKSYGSWFFIVLVIAILFLIQEVKYKRLTRDFSKRPPKSPCVTQADVH